jgi:hypothetical protein
MWLSGVTQPRFFLRHPILLAIELTRTKRTGYRVLCKKHTHWTDYNLLRAQFLVPVNGCTIIPGPILTAPIVTLVQVPVADRRWARPPGAMGRPVALTV